MAGTSWRRGGGLRKGPDAAAAAADRRQTSSTKMPTSMLSLLLLMLMLMLMMMATKTTTWLLLVVLRGVAPGRGGLGVARLMMMMMMSTGREMEALARHGSAAGVQRASVGGVLRRPRLHPWRVAAGDGVPASPPWTQRERNSARSDSATVARSAASACAGGASSHPRWLLRTDVMTSMAIVEKLRGRTGRRWMSLSVAVVTRVVESSNSPAGAAAPPTPSGAQPHIVILTDTHAKLR
jgi:hypothetical protein